MMEVSNGMNNSDAIKGGKPRVGILVPPDYQYRNNLLDDETKKKFKRLDKNFIDAEKQLPFEERVATRPGEGVLLAIGIVTTSILLFKTKALSKIKALIST